MPKARIDRIVVRDDDHDEYRYVEIEEDGDIYLSDGSDDDRTSILIRRETLNAVLGALRLARRLSE
jgi:hypothetical protein